MLICLKRIASGNELSTFVILLFFLQEDLGSKHTLANMFAAIQGVSVLICLKRIAC